MDTEASNVSPFSHPPVFVPIERSDVAPCFDESWDPIRLVSYNILAQAYLRSHFSPHSPLHCLRRRSRSQKLLAELLSFDADVLCLQELDEYEQFYKVELCKHGYSSIYLQRPGRTDGSGIFYRSRRLEVIETEFIQYNDLIPEDNTVIDAVGELPQTSIHADNGFSINEADRGDRSDRKVRFRRDCVGIMTAFRVLPSFDRIFLLANTQIYWDPDWADVKFAQVEYLVEHVLTFQHTLQSNLLCEIPVIMCGDFNSMPGDQVYSYLVSGGSVECTIPTDSKNKVIRRCALPLSSLYASMQKEPDFTNCTPEFRGTLDYIFFSSFDRMKPISLLQTPTIDSEDVMGGLPNQTHPSDHLPIGTDFVVLGSEKSIISTHLPP